MPLGLVSYGSSDDDDSETEQEEKKIELKKEEKNTTNEKEKTNSISVTEGEISDEEEIIPSVLDETDIDENIPGLSSSKSLFDSLPSISNTDATSTSVKNFIDENEDLSTIPKAKTYSENPDLMAMKPKKKKGPIRIMAPTLNSKIDEDDEERPSRVRGPSQKKSGLIGMLPPPKNSISTISSSNSNASKTVSKPMLIPRSVAKKTPLPSAKSVMKNVKNDSDDEEDVPFFTMDQKKSERNEQKSSMSLSVKANPEASHPRGIHPGSHPSHQFRYNEDSDFSAVTAPYPPPPPGPRQAQDQPQTSQDVLERLAGKSASKKRKGEGEGLDQIVDVNFEDIKPDEREWMTKALTEDDADAPGPKNTIKGERKRKHQITYLAAMAKERENELKKQWANSASNRRAAANKYGF